MEKIGDKLKNAGVTVGSRVSGLYLGTMKTLYRHSFAQHELITGITPHGTDNTVMMITTEELTAKENLGGKPLAVKNRQYAISSLNGLDVMRKTDGSAKGVFEKKKVTLKSTELGLETEFATVPQDLLTALKPLATLLATKADVLDDVMDVDEFSISIDGVVFNKAGIIGLGYAKTIPFEDR